MCRIFSLILLLLCSLAVFSQSVAEGQVAGSDSLPLPGVSIKNIRSGVLAVSAGSGHFQITARPGDTLLFTAIGHMPLAIQAGRLPAVLYLHTQITRLPGVEVRRRSHTADSLALREEYHKAFTFRWPRWNEIGMITPVGIGINIHKLYKALSFKSNKRSDVFKERLISHEQQKFIDQRFTPALVTRFTGLQGDSLVQFINICRPGYQFAVEASDYDFIRFIVEACAKFRRGL